VTVSTEIAGRDLSGEFPTLQREGLHYLDAAATSQTPRAVLAALDDYYEQHRASVHRGVYPLAVEATDLFEGARDRVAAFVGAPSRDTIFTKNATEAINLVAYSWGRANVGPGDRIVVTEMEHHSNFVPWHMLARERGATLEIVPVDDEGRLRLEVLDELLATGTVKVVAVVHVSNVVGTINPIAEIAAKAREAGAITVVDGAQAVPQLPVDVAGLGADFYAWTGHKAYGPTGIGVLHGRHDLLAAMPPFIGGGHMISHVTVDEIRWADVPGKFEAGTSNIAEAIGLGAAVDFLSEIGMERIRAHERDLAALTLERLAEVPGLTINGPRDADGRGALVSFTLDLAHPHDVAEILGSRGVCVRAGHHCAQPLMKCLGVGATTRASFALHNTEADIDALVEGIEQVRAVFA
jgi:cysteine desulfurase/selenocysteine lyase